MAALVDLTKRWPLKPIGSGDYIRCSAKLYGQTLPCLLFFSAGHSTFVIMSTRRPDNMLSSWCIDMPSKNSFKECKWTLTRS